MIWFWLAAVLAVWTLIVITALRWLHDTAEAGKRIDEAWHNEFSLGRADRPAPDPGD